MQELSTLSKIQKEVDQLNPEEQLVLIEHLAHKLRVVKNTDSPPWDELYGLGRGIWEEDAQQHGNKFRGR